MDDQARGFLNDLLRTPGVSGYEQPVQAVVREYVSSFAQQIETDLHGNLILCCNPGAATRVLFDGHCDQIGLIVSQIDDKGFLFAQTVGGWDPQQLVGQRLTVWADKPVAGVISRKPIHLLEEQEKKQVVKTDDLWIDIGAGSKKEAQSLVQVGDSVTLDLGSVELLNGLVTAPGLDNRCGLWVAVEAFRRAASESLSCSLYCVSAVQEEIGLRGAKTASFAVDPQIGIAIDVTHATDCPSMDAKQLGDIALGAGPVIFRGPNANPVVCQRLMDLGRQHSIAYQVAALGRAASNDSNALQVNRGGVATGLVAIPNRYMHSAVETVSLMDMDAAADLLAAFAAGVRDAAEFKPV